MGEGCSTGDWAIQMGVRGGRLNWDHEAYMGDWPIQNLCSNPKLQASSLSTSLHSSYTPSPPSLTKALMQIDYMLFPPIRRGLFHLLLPTLHQRRSHLPSQDLPLHHLAEAPQQPNPKPVVLFNPKWGSEEEKNFDGQMGSFVGSFNVVCSFMGLEVREVLSRRKGVVLNYVRDGVLSGEGWVVMVTGRKREEERERGKRGWRERERGGEDDGVGVAVTMAGGSLAPMGFEWRREG